ncbi:putative LRR receptor-like serine/threonine-protein kinase MEE39 [Cocos nucifera]|uniref:Putative LRR receptor-like serine/threonine-protein kinase MEE39 n=1 Tax=Cocos nucifera TaxID=13894 RepID=A0A8K0J0E4_COCNU|nr:putative LRR receptor-like serine/threonine-protein kinase MEE39 [Cocos nucifera]
MNTLRFFPRGEKNCYLLPGRGESRVLLRAGFYYGNYDGTSKPPTFDLQFDGHQWATVATSLDEDPIYHEVVYKPNGGSISVCLVRIGDDGGIPFISSLEVAPFPADIYREMDENMGFYLRSRDDFGATTDIRVGIDVDENFNRIWKAKGMPNYPNASSFPPKTPTAENYPPLAVINTAITASNSSDSLVLQIELPSINQRAYIISYFMEVVLIPDAINGRQFAIYINGQESNHTIQLKNDSCQVVSFYTNEFSGPANLTLSPLEGTILPPIINAMEVFTTINLDPHAGAPSGNHGNPFGMSNSEPSSMLLIRAIFILGVVTLFL